MNCANDMSTLYCSLSIVFQGYKNNEGLNLSKLVYDFLLIERLLHLDIYLLEKAFDIQYLFVGIDPEYQYSRIEELQAEKHWFTV